MFNREILNSLERWHYSQNHRPMVLRGARQVGKTTIVNLFAKNFANYIYLNLEQDSDRELIEMPLEISLLIELIFARKQVKRQPGDTLIFIDEIQNSAKAMSLLRYFYENTPWLFVVAAGSLLENIVDVKASFPVGRVDFLPLRPCSFREFMVALGQEGQIDLMSTPEYTIPFHNEYMARFNQYCIVGGMPEAVQEYVKHGDIPSVDRVHRRLHQAYMDDVEKYATTAKMTAVVRHIMRYGWSQAGATITLSNFQGSTYKSREVGEAFQLLQKAMLLELTYPTTSTKVPATPEMSRMPKLFWFDTGLVNYIAQVRTELVNADNILDVWKGRMAEQVVAQEILTLSDDVAQSRSFWTRGKGEAGAEVDLLWVIDSKLIPIEVKAGRNSHLRSLHSFIDASFNNLAVRVWSGPFSVDDVVTTIGRKPFRLINLPFYLIHQMENIVRRYV